MHASAWARKDAGTWPSICLSPLKKYNISSSRDGFPLKPTGNITNILNQMEVAGKSCPSSQKPMACCQFLPGWRVSRSGGGCSLMPPPTCSQVFGAPEKRHLQVSMCFCHMPQTWGWLHESNEFKSLGPCRGHPDRSDMSEGRKKVQSWANDLLCFWKEKNPHHRPIFGEHLTASSHVRTRSSSP